MKHFALFTASLSILALGYASAMAQPHDDRRPDDSHAAAHHDWNKGERIGHDDWSRGRPVDYHARHLRQPPHGYEWREVDGRTILAAVATGVIADVVINAAR